MADKTCCICGQPATLQAHSDETEPGSIRDYCADCAANGSLVPVDSVSDVQNGSLAGGLLLTSGVILGFLAVFADHLGIGGTGGFGWQQSVGLCAGLVLALVGSVFRVNLIAVGGFALLVLSLLADVLGVGRSPGLGHRQTAALVIAWTLLAAGCWLRRRRERAAG